MAPGPALNRRNSNTAEGNTASPLCRLVSVAAGISITAAGLWLLMTQSLPFALAPLQPDLAALFNPSHPAVLKARVESVRERWLQGLNPMQAEGGVDAGSAPTVEDAERAAEIEAERAALRLELRALAEQIIAQTPLDASAFRLLGETSDDLDVVRQAMQAAAARSKRESPAVFWLLADAYERRDHAALVEHAETLFLTRPQLASAVAAYVTAAALDPTGRPTITSALAAGARWRGRFLAALPRLEVPPGFEAELVLDVFKIAPLTPAELAPLFRRLVGRGEAIAAYDLWLQTRPGEQLDELGFVNNPGFEADPEPTPFDWSIGRGVGVSVAIGALPDGSGAQALGVTFGAGRAQFPGVQQTVVLGPGRYAISGKIIGTLEAERGLVWGLACLDRKPITESPILLGAFPAWHSFTFEAEVPNRPGCQAQTLTLRHAARSASEQFARGEVWFDDITIARLRAD
ncbi:MAG: hypothetical protein ACFCUN_04300 [Hyphomicrobiaceae bacterium]